MENEEKIKKKFSLENKMTVTSENYKGLLDKNAVSVGSKSNDMNYYLGNNSLLQDENNTIVDLTNKGKINQNKYQVNQRNVKSKKLNQKFDKKYLFNEESDRSILTFAKNSMSNIMASGIIEIEKEKLSSQSISKFEVNQISTEYKLESLRNKENKSKN